MTHNLTSGSVKSMNDGEQVDKPVLQLLGYKKIPGGSSGDRYRLLISDGIYLHPFAMLNTKLNHLIDQGKLEKFTVIRVDNYIFNQYTTEKKVMILLELTVVADGSEVKEKIGNPKAISDNPSAAPTTEMRPPEAPAARPNPIPAPTMSSNAGDSQTNVHPINSLNPYQQKWTIKARVTAKTPIRRWSNSKGEGHLFSMDLLDESGEIRATAFKAECDRFYDMMELNNVYYISQGQLKPANKQYTSIKNDYEITFSSQTQVTPCTDTSSTPMIQYQFVSLDQLENVAKDTIIDVIGVCKSFNDIQTIVSRESQKEFKKRDLQIVDKSNKQVTLALWGIEAEKFDGSQTPIIAVKNIKVSDYGGRSLSAMSSSGVHINPDIKEAHVLRGWYDREGAYLEMDNISAGPATGPGAAASWKTFGEIQGEVSHATEKPVYYSNKATITMIKGDNCMYMACPSKDCNKKVIDLNNNLYRCEKCQREYPSYEWRLLMNIHLADHTGDVWVTCFQEVAEAILETKAADLGLLKEQNDGQMEEIMKEANLKSFVFRIRAKMEVYNEESRIRSTVVSVAPLSAQDYGQRLMSDIETFSQML